MTTAGRGAALRRADRTTLKQGVATVDLWQWVAGRRQVALAASDLSEAPPAVREGALLADLLKHLPLGLIPGERLAGRFGPAWATPAELEAIPAPPPSAPRESPTPFELLSERFHCFGIVPSQKISSRELTLEQTRPPGQPD